MNFAAPSIADYVMIALIGGPLGALAMYGVVRVLNSTGWVKGNIIDAIGDLFRHRGKTTAQSGTVIHLVTSVAFAPLYLFVLSELGLTTLPSSVIGGCFFGFFHGVFVSLALVWVASNRPMLPKFTGARLPLGVMHCIGHIAYGAVLGLVVALLLKD
jgi:hypothetical protein